MHLLRSRHRELDNFRSVDPSFNIAWIMFFGTKPPGINPAAVFFTEAEREALANGVPIASAGGSIDVEPYDGRIHNRPRLGGMYGSR